MMKRAPAELYKTVINEVTYLIDSLGEPTEEKEILEQQNQAKKKLNGVHKDLQTSLEHLAKNADDLKVKFPFPTKRYLHTRILTSKRWATVRSLDHCAT